MRYGTVSDVHGADMAAAAAAFVNEHNVDAGICLGDFDRAHTARQMYELQRDGCFPWFVVPGNHDHAHVRRLDVTSGTMYDQRIDSQGMQEEWSRPENRDVRAYVEKMIDWQGQQFPNGSYAHRRIAFEDVEGIGKIVMIHGAYAGSGVDGVPEEAKDLWYRLRSPADYTANFAVMKQKGYALMLRGHDHTPAFVFQEPDGRTGSINPLERMGSPIPVLSGRTHAVTAGSLHEGYFSVLDTRDRYNGLPAITFHKDPDLAFRRPARVA